MKKQKPGTKTNADSPSDALPIWTACTCGGSPLSPATVTADPRMIVPPASLPDNFRVERIVIWGNAAPRQPVVLPETPPPEGFVA